MYATNLQAPRMTPVKPAPMQRPVGMAGPPRAAMAPPAQMQQRPVGMAPKSRPMMMAQALRGGMVR